LLTGATSSPTLAQQIQVILERFPEARWHVHEPAEGNHARTAAARAFGEPVDLRYRFDLADVVLSLESDFLSCGPGHLLSARDFMVRRRCHTAEQRDRMNRLYVVEGMPSLTGTKADHRWPLRSSQIESFLRGVAAALGVEVPGQAPADHDMNPAWVSALAADLEQHRGKSIVLAGESQPPVVHALACKINEVLGNLGETVIPTAPIASREDAHSLEDLAAAMGAGEVDVLLILDSNPVYSAPVDLNFADRMDRVPFRAHLGLYNDETAFLCHWHVPAAHYLESWGDARSHDGTVSMIQPLIAPLFGGKTAYELLALLTGQAESTSYDIVRSYWRSLFDRTHPWHEGVSGYWQTQGLTSVFSGNFERWWKRSLHAGFVADTSLPKQEVTVREDWHDLPRQELQPADAGALEIMFRADPTVHDGRFANNAWLQELPRPLTKLTWGNAAFLSPATAVRLGLSEQERPERANGQLVHLSYRGAKVEAPVWVVPGHVDNAVTLYLGYGRSRAGSAGTGVGVDAYKLRTSGAPWFDSGLTLTGLGREVDLASTGHHHLIENHGMTDDRRLIWSADVKEYDELVKEMDHHYHPLPSLYPERAYDGQKWGMVIDVNACTGCSACVVACQSENNIPVVGKEQIIRGREMHWLRIDTYFTGDPAHPPTLEAFHQPVPCMHCENAPCEPVCPVEATVHSTDGLNDMVYNRCVGTRYCSNNCPYKVRRFNFLQFADWSTETYRLMRNPDVTVRSQGVMEKCTYCVQRIRKAGIRAGRERRHVLDGEIQTACQAACPAGAIVFGDLNLPASRVAKEQSRETNYALLHEHNTRPRTTYLAALRNQNEEIKDG
jgi:molybdopterin-containing oxidoreductase family iron-sulfur binding subunit